MNNKQVNGNITILDEQPSFGEIVSPNNIYSRFLSGELQYHI
jgi:hypothetical protein